MRKRMLGPVLLAVAMLSFARDASADEGVDSVALFSVVGFGALDVGLAVSDLVAGAQGKWRSRAYGGFEAVAAGTQFAICLDQALTAGPGRSTGGWVIGAGFGAIFMTHGLVTLLAPRSHIEAPLRPDPVTVAPLALSDVARSSVPGVAVLGRF
jgi:hypothetical protein